MERDFWTRLFDSTGFVPRALCGNWTRELIWLHNASDFFIWTAYLAIPLVLVSFAWRRHHELPFRHLFWLFGLFILSCGTTHLMDIVLFYHPLYRLSGLVKLITAAASWGTIMALFQILPQALIARSNLELEREFARQLREREAASRLAATIVESSYDSIISKTPDGIILSWNAGAERIYGYSAEEAVGQSISLIVPPDRHEELLWLLEQVRQGERIQNYETVRLCKNGQQIHIALTLSPIRDDSGQVVAISNIARDITEKKQAEAEYQAITRKLEAAYLANQRMMDHSVDVICTVDSTGKFVRVSAACEKMWGYTPEEMKKLSAFDLVHPEDLPKTQQIAEKIISGEAITAFENRSTRKDGSFVPIVWSAAWSPEEQAMFCVARDNTEREKVETKLREAEGQLRAIMDNTPDVIYLKDQQYRFLMVNQQCENIFQAASGTLIGKTDYDILPADLADAIRKHDQTVLEQGATLKMEEAAVDRYGRRHIYLSSKFPIHNASGEIYAMAGISTDITERKYHEEALQAYAGKLEANNRELQEFAFIASHDLQEPLRKIQAFGDRLKTRHADTLGETGRDYLERMQSAAGRMQMLIENLLALSRVTTKAQPLAPVDLTQIVREVVSDLEVRIEQSGGRVEVGALPTIEADALQIRQLFQNLIGNALKFRHAEIPPVVKVSAECSSNGEQSSEGVCRFIVQDNGIGFDEEYRDRIFAPFQRLHGRGEYEGTGIGLAICRKIVERHNGQITAQSQPGQGATFIVTLPFKGLEVKDLERGT